MKKLMTILIAALSMTVMVACGNKDDGLDQPDQTDLIPEGRYLYQVTTSNGTCLEYYELDVVNTSTEGFISYGISKRPSADDEFVAHMYQGNYVFSTATGKGSADLNEIFDEAPWEFAGKAELTLKGADLTVKFLGETNTVKKVL